jgi:hypothetical protein
MTNRVLAKAEQAAQDLQVPLLAVLTRRTGRSPESEPGRVERRVISDKMKTPEAGGLLAWQQGLQLQAN